MKKNFKNLGFFNRVKVIMGPIIKLVSENDIELVQKIAWDAWPTTYKGFLAPEFIQFELKREYSRDSLLAAIKKGEAFYLFFMSSPSTANSCYGFFSLSQLSPEIGKLNKFYLDPQYKGQGFGKLMFQEMEKILKAKSLKKLQLLVNRQNPAVEFYKKAGFKIKESIDTPTNPHDPSFIRRDYLMEKCLAPIG